MNNEKIKNLRDELEITQNEISKILGCTRSAYSLWKINKNIPFLNCFICYRIFLYFQ